MKLLKHDYRVLCMDYVNGKKFHFAIFVRKVAGMMACERAVRKEFPGVTLVEVRKV